MYPNQQNQNGNGYPYPPAPNPGAPRPPQPPQPQNPYGAVPPLNNSAGAPGHNPYEFIMNPNSKRHGFGPVTLGKQIAVFAVLALIVIMGLFFAMSAFKPKSLSPQLIDIAQHQQEIVRVATLASKKVNGSSTRNFVITTQLSVISDQGKTIGYLAEQYGHKMKGKELALDANPKTDELLSNALAAGNYDATVAQVLTTQLETYEQLLQTTYKQATSKTTKAMLKQQFTVADDLLKQAESLQTAAN